MYITHLIIYDITANIPRISNPFLQFKFANLQLSENCTFSLAL